MRGLEDVNIPVLEVQRGNDQALSRVAELSIAELVDENLPETLRIVLGETNVPKKKEHPVESEARASTVPVNKRRQVRPWATEAGAFSARHGNIYWG